MRNGAIAAAGNFDTLSASGLDFAAILAREELEQKENNTLDSTSMQDAEESMIRQGSFRKRQLSIHSVSILPLLPYFVSMA